ncbi:hypothetical protein BurJ1DRAFT_1279 [Burkholderiales bacterium JOSHI_001]|nr:hypothetical protein BurJ1DRAFT_1279 [Burkholderiales bacterium JOSHI_001]
MKELLKRFRHHVRKFIGVEAQMARLEKQQQLLLETLSLLRHSVIDSNAVKSTETYRQCAEIVALLSPMDVEGARYVRVGRQNDGGYVMVDNFSGDTVDAAYSFGINDDVSWDTAVAQRGIDVFMFDHTIDALPAAHPRFHFRRLGVTGAVQGPDLRTLTEHIRENGHAQSRRLILKMDVEACEWDVFQQTPSEVIEQFSQIVMEVHELCPTRGPAHHDAVVQSLRKLNLTHQCVHVHANINCTPLWIGDKVLPDLMEVTCVRRSDVQGRLVENRRTFPTALDQPTYAGLPDLNLGYFR